MFPLPPRKHEDKGTLEHELRRIATDEIYSSAEDPKVLDKAPNIDEVTDIAEPNLSAPEVARLFAEQAKATLSATEFRTLLNFLTTPPAFHDVGYLENQISTQLASFFSAELALTGDSANRLASPSGPKDAELGLILHCQSKEGDVGEFWDKENRTIQALAEKGFSDKFVFGFDWHWRAEHDARSRGGSCPTTKWPQEQRDLHNKVSAKILETLPLRILVVASACAKKHYRRTLSPLTRTITIQIQPGTDITLDLDFRSEGLRRIVIYPDHPSSALFRPSEGKEVSFRLDAAANFSLWLVGRDYNENAFTESQAMMRRGVPGAAPFTEMHEYVRRENLLRRHLKQNEYQPSFLTWAGRFLQEDPALLLARGESLAQALRQNFLARIRAPEVQARRAENQRLTLAESKGSACREYWHGRVLLLEQFDTKFFVSLLTSKHLPTLKIFVGKKAYNSIKRSANNAVIRFSEEKGLFLKLGDEVIFERSRERLSQVSIYGARWLVQLDKELAKQKDGKSE